jgi:hypothetical protein
MVAVIAAAVLIDHHQEPRPFDRSAVRSKPLSAAKQCGAETCFSKLSSASGWWQPRIWRLTPISVLGTWLGPRILHRSAALAHHRPTELFFCEM